MIRYDDVMNIGGTSRTIYENRMLDQDIIINYVLMDDLEGEPTYVRMAHMFRDELIEQGHLDPSRMNRPQQMPLLLEVIGELNKGEVMLGIHYNRLRSLTTYRQATEILNDLNSRGVQAVNMRYIGWFNNGINHDVPKTVKLDSVVGSLGEMRNLNNALVANGGVLYPDVQLIRAAISDASRSGIPQTPNFSVNKEAAYWLVGYPLIYNDYHRTVMRPMAYYWGNITYVYSPTALPFMIDTFVKEYAKLGFGSLSLRDLGVLIEPDMNFNEDRQVSRATTQKIVEAQLDKVVASTPNLLINAANMYAFRYATMINGIPDNGNFLFSLDEQVPFLQIVLNGYIEYSAKSINLLDNYNKDAIILKLLETGEFPTFTVMWEDSAIFYRTAWQDFYNITYEDWADDIAYIYHAIAPFYAATRNATISDHIIHRNGVRETVYSNGMSVVINYNDFAVTADGVYVAPRSYEFVNR
jgi:hypothetical protein